MGLFYGLVGCLQSREVLSEQFTSSISIATEIMVNDLLSGRKPKLMMVIPKIGSDIQLPPPAENSPERLPLISLDTFKNVLALLVLVFT